MNNVSVSFVIKLCFTFSDCLRSQDGNLSAGDPRNSFINHTFLSTSWIVEFSVKEAGWMRQFNGRKRSWHKHLISKVFPWVEKFLSVELLPSTADHCDQSGITRLCCAAVDVNLGNLFWRHCRNIFRSFIKLMFVFMKIVYKFACPCVILRLETFLCVGFYGCCCLLSDISFSKITWGL